MNAVEQASMEFSNMLEEILRELENNKTVNLGKLKITVLLLISTLCHCYRWDDHSMLSMLNMSSLKTETCSELRKNFQMKIPCQMKLHHADSRNIQQNGDHCAKGNILDHHKGGI